MATATGGSVPTSATRTWNGSYVRRTSSPLRRLSRGTRPTKITARPRPTGRSTADSEGEQRGVLVDRGRRGATRAQRDGLDPRPVRSLTPRGHARVRENEPAPRPPRREVLHQRG